MADVTFELYKLLVEEAREARRARRELSNVFMTFNLGGIGGLGFLASGEHGLDPGLFGWCAFALALTCVIWRTTNSYYTVMLAAKYKEIYAIENRMGERPIQNEWQTIHGKRSKMKWFSLERAMPILFIIGYAVFFAVQAGGENIAILWDNVQGFFADLLARIGLG